MASASSMGIPSLILVLLGVLILVPFILRFSRIFEGFENKKPAGSACQSATECEGGKCARGMTGTMVCM